MGNSAQVAPLLVRKQSGIFSGLPVWQGAALLLLLVWLYAAMRPRFGAGVRTAVYTGLIIWALGGLLPNIMNAVIGLYSTRLTIYSTLAGMVELVVGSTVGAALYKEAETVHADYPVAAEASSSAR